MSRQYSREELLSPPDDSFVEELVNAPLGDLMARARAVRHGARWCRVEPQGDLIAAVERIVVGAS